MNDQQGVVDELVAKLDTIFEANRDQNFVTEMYAGQLEINCSPPFGTMEYYRCMENDAARALMKIVSGSSTGFVTGKAFLDCLRIVLAKISILDWTSMDKSTQHFVVADTKQKLPGILRTGCHVSLPLVKDKTIPSHLKEDVLRVGSQKRLKILLREMCEEFPGFESKWMALNDIIPLDNVKDEELDMGFDASSLTSKDVKMVQKTIDMLFKLFLPLRGKTHGSSRLTAGDQNDFDVFTAFVLRRRKIKVSRWLHGSLGGHLSETYFMAKGNDIDIEDRKYQVGEQVKKSVPCFQSARSSNAPEREEAGDEASYCVLDAWHQPELKPDGADNGFAYVDGHKFECVHAVNTGKYHNIFVLDNSGSMSGQPWQDLLCACNEFGISRLKDGGENDLVSYVTFDHESRIFCEGEPLPEALKMSVPFSGGGTSYGKGLRAANEVLSRNDFEEFKVVLIFFSDGQPCDIELGITLAYHIRSSYAKYDLKAFVVGFGYVNLPVLQRVASEMGGEYRQVLDANALRTKFQRIAAVLCNSEASLALMEIGEGSS
ncbi:hypothetical protein PI125_g11059 [Phytophthora idaei]|nr:hypothetical protein PI125_g11059 [Phytophthora idaei]